MINSAKMHPTDHMSIAVEYVLAPSNISGALRGLRSSISSGHFVIEGGASQTCTIELRQVASCPLHPQDHHIAAQAQSRLL